jgi:VanW like protein
MNTLLALAIYAITTTKTVVGGYLLGTQNLPAGRQGVRAEREFSLTDRYPDPGVNEVFRYNILHTLSLMNSKSYSFTLNPGKVFAFHEDVLPEFKGKVTQTMNAHFNYTDGFKSDGYLTGDGVCHLASLIYWAAKDAGLSALAPTNHSFANIPEVPKEYGVSIYYNPATHDSNAQQNLYITNTFDKPVEFAFAIDGTNLSVKVMD